MAPLTEYAEVNPPAGSIDRMSHELVAFVPMAAVSEEGRLVSPQTRPLAEVATGYTYFERNDVLMAKITPCMENGKAALLDSLEPARGFGSTEFHVLRPRPGVDPRFLFYIVWNQRFRYEAAKHMTGTAGQKRVPAGYLKSVQVPRIDAVEQRRIADILDKADAIRRKRKEAIALTEELLRSAFLEMFGDPVTNPKGWEVRPLGGLVAEGDSINYGVVQPGSEVANGVPLIRVGDFDGMTINIDGLKRISRDIEANYARSRLRGDEVLVACVGSIGKVALVDSRLAGANIARAVARIRPGKLLNREYLAYFLETPFVQRHFSVETRTVSQPTLNIKQIQETPVLVPPLKEQDAFMKLERRLRVVGTQQRAALVCTDTLFDTLVHRAFQGELTSVERPC
jgi:type I restriction enzyme S subunit